MSQSNPNNTDAVLGGQTPPPVTAAVLGGVAGERQRIAKEWGLSEESLSRFSFETVFVNENAEIIDRQQKEAFCYTVYINGVPLELVYVPAGSFMMGGIPQSRYQPEKELAQPIHQVTLESFFIGKYPITQKQYLALTGLNPAYFKGNDRHPVESVSWHDAMGFCKKLSDMAGKNFTLPSESQWEYTCRAGTDRLFYFGRSIDANLVNFDNADRDRYTINYFRGMTSPIGTYPPNSWGVYDLHGNVRDWCLDTYHYGYIDAPADGSAWIDPAKNDCRQDSQRYRVFRGGSWNDTWDMCTSYQRGFMISRESTRQNGFRICLNKI